MFEVPVLAALKQPVRTESGKYGAFHSGEIAFALNSLAKWDRPWSGTDRRIAEQMPAYWVNFARNGDSNGPGLPMPQAESWTFSIDTTQTVVTTP